MRLSQQPRGETTCWKKVNKNNEAATPVSLKRKACGDLLHMGENLRTPLVVESTDFCTQDSVFSMFGTGQTEF